MFCTPEDEREMVYEGFLSLLPFDLEKEKIHVKQSTAKGFHEREIKIFEVRLEKQHHINAFLKHLVAGLSKEQKGLLVRQAESRLDEGMCFYIRLDKEKLIREHRLWLTDRGGCYHLKLTLAPFPKRREQALDLVKEMFSP